MRFFVVCPGGLEVPLAQELAEIAQRPDAQALGAWVIDPTPTSPTGGIGLAGPLSAAMALNLHSRIASRVLLQMAQAPYRQEDDLYKLASGLAWEDWFSSKQTLRVDVTAHRSPLKSLNFATLKIKDAIVDRLRDVTGDRPNIDTTFPDVRVQAHLTATHVTIYLDTSGEALFKRGWRDEKGDAPLKENLAAGILTITGWRPGQTLFDPMCGSGTFLIEAAHKALAIPPGGIRAGMYGDGAKPSKLAYRPLVTSADGFGFQRLKPFNEAAEQKRWASLKESSLNEILGKRKQYPDAQSLGISGSDINEKLVSMFKGNWQRAQLPDQPPVRQVDAMASKPPSNTQDGIMLLNPPYGERLVIKGGRGQGTNLRDVSDDTSEPENRFELNLETGRQSAKRSSRESLKKLQAQEEQDPKFVEFLRQFGQHLKNAFGGWNVFVLTADMALPGQLRIKESKRTPLFNGPLECRLFKFEMHQKRAVSSHSEAE
ncbi:class I SAM-dependent RNA methyltransferase [Polynucleobacter sp. MWH-UH25E]|uniref:THUMP domain-containing class I SAM-dependent RNA methyltransferase n=1 Tax=Polynucleobacter sp. MWH-UH25E TaxID=1855616 RepID=UPI001BFD906A|nr:class I SAM-dependent RNA methyltransferase [Polynucleobacter sp. MWH-UH25E]QWD62284.1 class I SAM-dependent RNA methyltransferase [Polynucleobacter sp. MWH-UH25E]